MYKHTQIGWVTGISLGLGVLLCIYIGIQEPNWILFSLLGVLIICLILFSTLTVLADHRSIVVWFGPGVIRKKLSLEEIESSKVVRNFWLSGWGIRKIPKGWLFNVSGLYAVELSLKSGKVFRIGTDEPHILNNFLQKRLSERS